MSTTTYLITGSSRSLGLGYTRQLLSTSPSVRVVAAVRDPSNASQLDPVKKEYGDRLFVVKCDVTDSKSTQEAAKTLESSGFLGSNGLDVVIANAGVAGGGGKSATQFTDEDLHYNLSTNLYGVINTVNAFLPFLRQGQKKQIFVTSSWIGSLKHSTSSMATAYAISKTAVNMYSLKLARELAEDGFTVIPFHPGYVKTDMNASHGGGDITTEEASKLASDNVFLAIKKEDNGKFINYDGKEIPW
ncbi:hypothetical protein JCM16303_006655 [Sporobolomyces ruberrimus]